MTGLTACGSSRGAGLQGAGSQGAGVLVVVPEAGQAGFYSDWYNRGRGGPPGWETFHLTELRQLLERQADVWAAHDPYDLAPRLRGVDLFVSVGNGQPGPLDGPATTEQARRIEQAVQPQNLAFVERLHQLGIPVQFDAYGAGTHDWPYWQRELHRSLPLLLHALQRP